MGPATSRPGPPARLDRGVLGVVAITVASAGEAVSLLRGRNSAGLRVLTARTVVVTSNAERIPVGVDGEAVSLPAPVQCAIRHRALRVRVPRDRPGVPPPTPAISLPRLRRLAPGRRGRGRAAGRRTRRVKRRPGPGRQAGTGCQPLTKQLTELRGVLARARELSVRTMIFDVEPLVAWWDSGQQALDRGVAAVLAELDEVPELQVLVFATNSARKPSVIPPVAGVQVRYLGLGRASRFARPRTVPSPGRGRCRRPGAHRRAARLSSRIYLPALEPASSPACRSGRG